MNKHELNKRLIPQVLNKQGYESKTLRKCLIFSDSTKTPNRYQRNGEVDESNQTELMISEEIETNTKCQTMTFTTIMHDHISPAT